MIYDRMLVSKVLQNAVLSFTRTARLGVPYHTLSDHRLYRDYGPNPEALSRLPWVIYEPLSGHIHPLFFLDDSGFDLAHGLLALRRSLEFEWDLKSSDCASY